MRTNASLQTIAVLPRAPVNGSPVPSLTSLYHKAWRDPYGDARYPGNCSGELIKDLLLYFRPKTVFDPKTGSGTCRDVCDELDIECRAKDIRLGFDASDPKRYDPAWKFDFVWVHPPYWRQKLYSDDARDMSAAPTLEYFLHRYDRPIRNLAGVLNDGGKLAVLMGDYSDNGTFVPLTYWTKRLAFTGGLRQRTVKDWYGTEEVAELLGKAEFTVREWCRLGRIKAEKKGSGRGKFQSWVVSHAELQRFQRDGLLPIRTPR